jgi:TonB family protein
MLSLRGAARLHGVCTCVMNMSVSTLLPHRGSFGRAPHWRASISLALSIALHATLLILLLRPVAPAESPSRVDVSPGRSDVVTVYLRDSRKLSPPVRKPQLVRAPGSLVDVRSDNAEMPRPQGRQPVASVRAPASMAREEAAPGERSRTTNKVPVTLARNVDAARSKPSPVDQQGNRAVDSNAQYLREVAARLSQVKHYPQLAVVQHEEGTVLLSFQIDRAGRLLAWNIASSSGHVDLDVEVGRMIAAAAPFPPFPSSWEQPEKVFEVPIGFYLH